MRETVSASACNIIVFAVWVGVPLLAPEADEALPRMFGPHPFGFPVQRLVFVAMCLLYLPLMPAVCGTFRLVLTQAELRRAIARRYIGGTDRLYAVRRPAVRWIWFGITYFLALTCGWVAWAESHRL